MELLIPEFGLLIWTVVTTVSVLLMLFAIYSILTTEFKDGRNKLAFLIGVIFLPILGPIVYLNNRKTLKKTNTIK